MFKSAEVEDLSAEDDTELDLESADVEDVVDTEDELDIEVQDTADTPVPDVETDEQEV